MTEVTDIILPGNEGSFAVGRRSEISGVSGLDPFHLRLIEGPVTATVATYDSGGKARLTPMWWGADGTHVLLNTKKGRLKCNNLLDRGEVSIQVMDPETRVIGSRSTARSWTS